MNIIFNFYEHNVSYQHVLFGRDSMIMGRIVLLWLVLFWCYDSYLYIQRVYWVRPLFEWGVVSLWVCSRVTTSPSTVSVLLLLSGITPNLNVWYPSVPFASFNILFLQASSLWGWISHECSRMPFTACVTLWRHVRMGHKEDPSFSQRTVDKCRQYDPILSL